MKQTARTRWMLPLTAALLAAACGGDDIIDPAGLDYRPWETVAQVNEVVGPVLSSENAVLGITAAGEALTQYSAEPAAAMLRFGSSLDVRSATRALRQARPVWSTEVTLPPAIVGRTLVWDQTDARYVVDEARTDAPDDGVRVVYYAMNPFTNQPAAPLLPLGHIDLTDEDITGEERLGIQVVDTPESGPVVLLDYWVGFTGSGQASAGNFTFRAVGTHGETAFDLTQAFTWNEAEDSDALAVDYQYSLADDSVRVRMDASSAFEAPVWELVDLLVDVTDGDRAVALEVGIAESGALDGVVRLDGTPVVAISGVDGDPDFTYPGGGRLTADEVESLRELWNLVTNVLAMTNALMAPGTLLLLPG